MMGVVLWRAGVVEVMLMPPDTTLLRVWYPEELWYVRVMGI